MKSLRTFVLMFAVSASPVFVMQAHAQQEVDPDHFDRPAATQAGARNFNAQSNSHADRVHQHVKTASKHSVRKNHHQVQAS
jgi:hypothetical protein